MQKQLLGPTVTLTMTISTALTNEEAMVVINANWQIIDVYSIKLTLNIKNLTI